MSVRFKSLRIFATQFNLHQRLAFWLIGLLLLTKFSPIAALLTVLVVSLQVVLGESLIARFSSFNHLSSLAKVGLGFCGRMFSFNRLVLPLGLKEVSSSRTYSVGSGMRLADVLFI